MTVISFMRPISDDRLTERQQEFADFVKSYERRHGKSPTFREIALGLNVTSKGSVSAMINKLVKKGVLTREHGTVRGLHAK